MKIQNKKLINVVACIIPHGKNILVAQRRADAKHFANKWEFPGGKVEPGETLLQAAEREAKEELGFLVTPKYPLVSKIVQDTWHVHFIWCQWDGARIDFVKDSPQNWGFFDLEEIRKLDFIASDMGVAEDVLARINTVNK